MSHQLFDSDCTLNIYRTNSDSVVFGTLVTDIFLHVGNSRDHRIGLVAKGFEDIRVSLTEADWNTYFPPETPSVSIQPNYVNGTVIPYYQPNVTVATANTEVQTEQNNTGTIFGDEETSRSVAAALGVIFMLAWTVIGCCIYIKYCRNQPYIHPSHKYEVSPTKQEMVRFERTNPLNLESSFDQLYPRHEYLSNTTVIDELKPPEASFVTKNKESVSSSGTFTLEQDGEKSQKIKTMEEIKEDKEENSKPPVRKPTTRAADSAAEEKQKRLLAE